MKEPTPVQARKIKTEALRDLEYDLRLRGYAVPRRREDRPFEVYFYSDRVVRFRIKEILEFSCAYSEALDSEVLSWVVDVYDSNACSVAPPSPPVPVTDHWRPGEHPCSTYLWSLAGIDAYVEDRGLESAEALVHYDPRRKKENTT